MKTKAAVATGVFVGLVAWVGLSVALAGSGASGVPTHLYMQSVTIRNATGGAVSVSVSGAPLRTDRMPPDDVVGPRKDYRSVTVGPGETLLVSGS